MATRSARNRQSGRRAGILALGLGAAVLASGCHGHYSYHSGYHRSYGHHGHHGHHGYHKHGYSGGGDALAAFALLYLIFWAVGSH